MEDFEGMNTIFLTFGLMVIVLLFFVSLLVVERLESLRDLKGNAYVQGVAAITLALVFGAALRNVMPELFAAFSAFSIAIIISVPVRMLVAVFSQSFGQGSD